MQSETNKSGRGGHRDGAGRPRSDRRLYTFRAPGALARIIESQANKTDFIRDCIARAVAGSVAGSDTGSVVGSDVGLAQIGVAVPAERVKDVHLPYFDIGIVAGFPIPLDNEERAQDIELLRMLCPHPESCYLIRVDGNSMIDAGISSGDIVIVDKSQRNPGPEDVAVCEFNGEYTLKRFERQGDTGWLVPANPDYPRIKVTPSDSFAVWGTVTYIIHRPRC